MPPNCGSGHVALISDTTANERYVEMSNAVMVAFVMPKMVPSVRGVFH